MADAPPQILQTLRNGEQATIRPRGNSMLPRILSGATLTVAPVSESRAPKVGDVVVARVRGNVYFHAQHVRSRADDPRCQATGRRVPVLRGVGSARSRVGAVRRKQCPQGRCERRSQKIAETACLIVQDWVLCGGGQHPMRPTGTMLRYLTKSVVLNPASVQGSTWQLFMVRARFRKQ